MERNSKTTKEIFNELYHMSEVVENPVKALEAIGWLKCTKQYIPSMEQWIDTTIDFLIVAISINFFGKEN